MDEVSKPHIYSQEEQASQTIQITQSRKRQIDSDSDDQPLAKLPRLTRRNLSLFIKLGKKKTPESTDGSTTTKTTSTTTSGFAIQAYKNGIVNPSRSKPPTNHDTRRERGAESRGTASPTEKEHRGFVRKITGAGNEATMVFEVGTKLLKEYDDEGYTRAFNRAFTAFPQDVGFNNSLSAPQPDFVEGLEMQDYLPFPVDEHVNGSVLYKDNPQSITLPHLAGEWKGPDGSMQEAVLQSSYDGAALAYSRNQALAYMGKCDPPGHAEITTFTTDGSSLNLFAHYAAETEDKTLEYHQYLEASYNLMKFNEYKDGRRHLRNEQDQAKKQSYDLRNQLKEHWKQQRHNPINEGVQPLSVPGPEPPSTCEEAAGYEVVEQPCQSTPAAPTEPHKASPSHSSNSSHKSSSDNRKRKASSSQTSSPGHVSKHRSY